MLMETSLQVARGRSQGSTPEHTRAHLDTQVLTSAETCRICHLAVAPTPTVKAAFLGKQGNKAFLTGELGDTPGGV